jgi:hypothetical protein
MVEAALPFTTICSSSPLLGGLIERNQLIAAVVWVINEGYKLASHPGVVAIYSCVASQWKYVLL